MPKYIFVTGGVVSSLGKGLTTASVGLLLERRGLKVELQKIDPYINVDPGTMSPFQHGEVYVTEDGAETDLDLGHYERFTNCKLTKESNFTTGRVYFNVIRNERRGDYLGQTVQVVPHITDEIKRLIRGVARDENSVVIAEVGGTVGDIESLPFLESARQMRLEMGPANVLFIHLTLLPYLHTSGEIKSKPTQHSVGKLREIGIQPDIIICRAAVAMTEDVRNKISLFCNVSRETVIEERDVEHSIYEIPVVLHKQRLDDLILTLLHLKANHQDLSDWEKLLDIIKSPQRTCRIALVGKYVALSDAYKSIYEALTHGAVANYAGVQVKKVSSEDVEKFGAAQFLSDVDGILVPGGFGDRGIEGKIETVRYARENRVPFLGICLGMQVAVIEFARNVCGLSAANSTEFDKSTNHPVIDLLEQQRTVSEKGGTMRLGAYPCIIAEGGKSYEAYRTNQVSERHRHRYEFNNSYRDLFFSKGMVPAGLSPGGELVEMIELRDHPWFVAVQFHPEFKSRLLKPHPLFAAFVKAALATRSGS
jgi:CTP synthase